MDTPIPDAHLLAFLAGALEPGPAAEIAGIAHRERRVRERLHELERQLVPKPRRFRIPPPGVHGGRAPVQMWARPAAVMSADAEDSPHDHRLTAHPGARWRLHIAAQPKPHTWIPVVLEHPPSGDWSVAFPEDETEVIHLADLPSSTGGAHLLDLSAPLTPGVHRMALALMHIDRSISWDAPPDAGRWKTLEEGLTDGSIPVVAVQIHVLP